MANKDKRARHDESRTRGDLQDSSAPGDSRFESLRQATLQSVSKGSDFEKHREKAYAATQGVAARTAIQQVFAEAWATVRHVGGGDLVAEMPPWMLRLLQTAPWLTRWRSSGDSAIVESAIEQVIADAEETDVGAPSVAIPRRGSDGTTMGVSAFLRPPRRGGVGRISRVPSEARLQLARALRSVTSSREFQSLFQETIPTALRGLEEELREAKGGRIAVADVVIGLLIEAGMEPLREPLAPYIRRYVEPDRVSEADWWKTVGALADMLPIDTSRLSFVYYDEVIEDVFKKWNGRRPAAAEVDPEEWEVLQADANNIAARIGGIFQGMQREVTPEGRSVIMAGIEIAVAATLARPTHGLDNFESSVFEDGFWREIQRLGVSLGRLLTMLDAMNTIGVEWNDHPLTQATMFAVASVARAARGIGDRTASSFFNSGVSLLRQQRNFADRAKAAKARALLNLLGLCWALQLNAGLRDAMVAGDGLDCTVNLFGAIIELNTAELRQDIVRLVDSLRQFVDDAATDAAGDYERLHGAWERLGIATPAAPHTPADHATIFAAATGLLERLGDSLIPGTPGTKNLLERTVQLVPRCIEVLCEPREWEATVAAIRSRIDVVGAKTRDPVATFVDNFSLVHRSLLLAGLEPRWDDLVARAMVPRCDSLADAFTEVVHALLGKQ